MYELVYEWQAYSACFSHYTVLNKKKISLYELQSSSSKSDYNEASA